MLLKNHLALTLVEDPVERLPQSLHDTLARGLQDLQLIADRLQSSVSDARKVSLASAFASLPRMVRQLSKQLGKPLRFEMEGTERRVDKATARALSAALVHVLRNGADHGIEPTQDRVRRGKPAEGTIVLRCETGPGAVHVTVDDDGGGLDEERILTKAVEKGLVDPEKASMLRAAAIHELIFLPGFSTASAVTSVSGRGVGMDAVRGELAKVGGTVKVESTRGRGSRFLLAAPIAKSIVVENAVLVKCGDLHFVLPNTQIAGIHRVSPDTVRAAGAHLTLGVGKDVVPVGTYEDLVAGTFAMAEGRRHPPGSAIVLLRSKGWVAGLLVDALLKQFQAVIRPLPAPLTHIPGVRGITSLGNDVTAYVLASDLLAEEFRGTRASRPHLRA